MIFKRKPKPSRPEIVDQLRRVSKKLTGWSLTGAGEAPDLRFLLSDAADEIEQLNNQLFEKQC